MLCTIEEGTTVLHAENASWPVEQLLEDVALVAPPNGFDPYVVIVGENREIIKAPKEGERPTIKGSDSSYTAVLLSYWTRVKLGLGDESLIPQDIELRVLAMLEQYQYISTADLKPCPWEKTVLLKRDELLSQSARSNNLERLRSKDIGEAESTVQTIIVDSPAGTTYSGLPYTKPRDTPDGEEYNAENMAEMVADIIRTNNTRGNAK